MCLQRDKRTHRKDLFDEDQVIPLDVQQKLDTCQIVNSGLNGQSMPFVNNLFSSVSEVSTHVSRSSIKNDLHVPKTRLDVARANLKFVVVDFIS